MNAASITKQHDLGLRLGTWDDWSVPALGAQKVLVYPSTTSLKGPSGEWLCAIVGVDDKTGEYVAGTWSPVFARKDQTNPSGFVLTGTHATEAEAKDDALRLLRNAEASFEQGRQKTRMTRWRYNIDGTVRPREPTMWLMIILSGYIGISMSMSIFDPQQPLTVTGVALVGGTIGTFLVMGAALITSSVVAFVATGLPGRAAEKLFGARVNFAILAHMGCNWGAIAILAVAALWLATDATGGQTEEEDRRLAVRTFFGEPIVRLNEDMTYDWTTLDGKELYKSAVLFTAPEHREAAKYAMSAPITAVVDALDCEKEHQRCEDGREAVRLWNQHDGVLTAGATGETIKAPSAGVLAATGQSRRLAHIFSQAQARMYDTLAQLLVTSHELDAEEQRSPTSLIALLRTMAEMERSR